jgi:SAM-dependent methyltransferase
MVMSTPEAPRSPGGRSLSAEDQGRGAPGLPAKVIWHDLECGSYRADLPLWRTLSARQGNPVLDVGAGTGRVALDLARTGHHVTALDLDPVLLGALRERTGDLPVDSVCADARSFELSRRDFALCLVPMQTLQLLDDASGRIAFLTCALAHLRPGGLLACAIVTELDAFDIADGSPGPSPEISRVGELLYVSQANSVRVLPQRIVIERSRRIASLEADQSAGHRLAEPVVERNVIELARVNATELEREGSQVGFDPEPALTIEPTDEHVGSAVVMLRA